MIDFNEQIKYIMNRVTPCSYIILQKGVWGKLEKLYLFWSSVKWILGEGRITVFFGGRAVSPDVAAHCRFMDRIRATAILRVEVMKPPRCIGDDYEQV